MTTEVLKEVNSQINMKEKSKSWNVLLEKFPNLFEYEDIESSNFLMIAETPYDLVNNQEKIDKLIRNNIQKCINWCNKYHIQHHIIM